MRSLPRWNQATMIGLALGADRVTAWVPARDGGSECWSRPLDGSPAQGGEWPDLRDALVELRERSDVKAASLHVALLPPLVEVRFLDLRRLRDDELRRVLRREASRYFLLADPDRTVVGGRASSSRRRPGGSVLAAAAPSDVVDGVLAAAADVGWGVSTIIPAHVAWEQAARAIWPALASGPGAVVVLGEARTEVLRLRDGSLEGVRRARSVVAARAHEHDESTSRAAHAAAVTPHSPVGVGGLTVVDDMAPDIVGLIQLPRDPADTANVTAVGIVGAGPVRERLAGALADSGIRVVEAESPTRLLTEAEALAARFVVRAEGPELLPEAVHVARHRDARRSAGLIAVCAAVILMIVAGIEFWRLGRELAAVEARRAQIRPGVAEAMAARDVLIALNDRLRALRAVEAHGPKWTAVIPMLAERLPRDAHLIAIHAVGDSLVLEGEATSAAAVFEAFRAAPGIEGVRANAPIHREVRDGGSPVERFTVALRISSPIVEEAQ